MAPNAQDTARRDFMEFQDGLGGSSSSFCHNSSCVWSEHSVCRCSTTSKYRMHLPCASIFVLYIRLSHSTKHVFFYLQATIAAPADPYALPAATGHIPKSITVYQYEVCPFCCKVKTFLDYHKVSSSCNMRISASITSHHSNSCSRRLHPHLFCPVTAPCSTTPPAGSCPHMPRNPRSLLFAAWEAACM